MFRTLAVAALVSSCLLACIPPGAAGVGADGGSTVNVPSECPAAGTPTPHQSSITVSESWSGAHLLKYDTSIEAGVTITLAPCAVLLLEPGHELKVKGVLDAQGEPAHPVTITRAGAAAWATLRVVGPGQLRLVNTRVEGGGDPLNWGHDLVGMIVATGDQGQPTQEVVHVEHVALSGSASNGIVLLEGAGFSAASTDLRIDGAAGYPMSIWSRSAGTVPSGRYTGNAVDEILLPTNALAEQITMEDVTLHERGVPYHVGAVDSSGELRVGTMPGEPVRTLTIEPGTTLRFKRNGLLAVEHYGGSEPASGALYAVGTNEKPIIFTSAEPAPMAGDWLGISFGGTPSDGSRIAFATVQYAGGVSSSGSSACPYPKPLGVVLSAAIRIAGRGKPSTQFVTDTTIADSLTHGIDRGWRDFDKLDFIASNTFVNIGACLQTYPSDDIDQCPEAPPCPVN